MAVLDGIFGSWFLFVVLCCHFFWLIFLKKVLQGVWAKCVQSKHLASLDLRKVALVVLFRCFFDRCKQLWNPLTSRRAHRNRPERKCKGRRRRGGGINMAVVLFSVLVLQDMNRLKSLSPLSPSRSLFFFSSSSASRYQSPPITHHLSNQSPITSGWSRTHRGRGPWIGWERSCTLKKKGKKKKEDRERERRRKKEDTWSEKWETEKQRSRNNNRKFDWGEGVSSTLSRKEKKPTATYVWSLCSSSASWNFSKSSIHSVAKVASCTSVLLNTSTCLVISY